MSERAALAFIGTGIMGEPMAGHVLDRGHRLAVFNRTPARAERLLEAGARLASSPADAAAGADVVLICVGDTPDVEQVLFGKGGVAESARAGMVVVDHSTISPSFTREAARRLAERGAGFVDAPISGGDIGARAGTLSIMCGGDVGHFKAVRPILECYGQTITHCGPAGSGQLTKLVNQILVAVTNLAVCEALTFARKAGLDGPTTIAAVEGGAAGSFQLSKLGPRMLEGDFAPGFMIDLQQKDLRLVLEFARERNICLPGLGLVSQLFASAQAQGRGREGTQALITVLEGLNAAQSRE